MNWILKTDKEQPIDGECYYVTVQYHTGRKVEIARYIESVSGTLKSWFSLMRQPENLTRYVVAWSKIEPCLQNPIAGMPNIKTSHYC